MWKNSSYIIAKGYQNYRLSFLLNTIAEQLIFSGTHRFHSYKFYCFKKDPRYFHNGDLLL